MSICILFNVVDSSLSSSICSMQDVTLLLKFSLSLLHSQASRHMFLWRPHLWLLCLTSNVLLLMNRILLCIIVHMPLMFLLKMTCSFQWFVQWPIRYASLSNGKSRCHLLTRKEVCVLYVHIMSMHLTWSLLRFPDSHFLFCKMNVYQSIHVNIELWLWLLRTLVSCIISMRELSLFLDLT